MKIKQFTILLIIIALAVGLISWALIKSIPLWITEMWLPLLIFITAVNFVMYSLTLRAKQKNAAKFTTFYMAATIAKLLIYLAAIIAFAFFSPYNAKAFLITFLAYYIIFSVFETVAITRRDEK